MTSTIIVLVILSVKASYTLLTVEVNCFFHCLFKPKFYIYVVILGLVLEHDSEGT